MKKFLTTILVPLVILLAVVGLLGAGWWWGATHTQLFANTARAELRDGMRRPALDGGNPQFRPRPEGFEGREFGGRAPSLLRGLGGIVGSLVKLAVIVLLVLLVQRGLAWFDAWRANRQTPPAAPPVEPQG